MIIERIKLVSIVCFFLMLNQCLLGQRAGLEKITLEWEGVQVDQTFENQEQKYVSFEGATINTDSNWLPYFSVSYELGYNASGSFLMKDLVFEPVTKDEETILRKLDYQLSDISIHEYVSYKRKKSFLEVFFVPIRLNRATGKYEKLVSFVPVVSKSNSITNRNKRGRTYRTNSVLSQGNWYRIAVTEDDIYKLTYSDLVRLGLSPESLDAASIRVFGNGGGMLPFNNSEDRIDDLEEVAVQFELGNDNVFNSGDYLLFYGQGQDRWNFSGSSYSHVKNFMADTTYYFVTTDYSLGTPKRVTTLSNQNSPQVSINTYDDYKFYEVDRTNLIKSGRMWFGESFAIQKEYTIPFGFTSRVVSEPIFVRASVASRAIRRSSQFTLRANDQDLFTIDFPTGVTSGYANDFAIVKRNEGSIVTGGASVSIDVEFENKSTADNGWLDYIEIVAKSNLVFSGKSFAFRSREEQNVQYAQYTITLNANRMAIWNVSNHNEVFEVVNLTSQPSASFVSSSGAELNEFMVFDPTSCPKPTLIGQVANQDLHNSPQVDYVIVTHPRFLAQANELANFHRETYQYEVHVVTTNQVYNEFSGGNQDITGIKSYMKMLYDRAGLDDSKMPRYLLLFGDGSYNYKSRDESNSNFVPSYQSLNSVQPTRSYVSDDYFGFLDDSESDRLTSSLDIGIGRFPVRTVTEARNAVEKIKRYHRRPDILQPWRGALTFVGDDQDNRIHMRDADDLAKRVQRNYPIYNLNKIYFDAYPQVTSAAGQRYPRVNEAITDAVSRGTLITTYLGHGGETGWAHERVLTVPEINGWTNSDRLSLFLTATCEFSRYDDPDRTSGGEYVFLNPDGGGIGLLTTTRLVYSSPNKELADTFFEHAFKKVNGSYPSLGDLLRLSKDPNNITTSNGVNYRNFALLGDPGIQLAYPDYQVMLSQLPDTIKALEQVTIKGYVANEYGVKLTDFNGVVYPTVYDQPRDIATLDNDGVGVFNFQTQTSPVFRGKASVKNGDFTFTFVVPKDISFTYGTGRISLYATNNEEDALGFSEEFTIGNRSDSAANDSKGPEVQLWMNDEQFVMGGVTDESPILLSKVFDEHGINTVGNGIGHDIVAVLDENTAEALILNDYYESETDNFQRGQINYPFSSLSEGKHTLSLKVWDVYNNSGEARTEFIVANSSEFAIKNLLNYPNPFTTYTEFHFDHNAPAQPMSIRIQIFTIAGKLVKTIDTEYISDGYHAGPIVWDGLDDFGDNIGRGTYIYRVQVTPPSGEKTEEFEKLVILK